MASWLKAAEDLFEVVDRRAKLVVNELSDEQANLQSSGSQTKKTKPLQAKKQFTTNGSPKTGDAIEVKLIKKALQDPEPELVFDKDNVALSREVEGDPSDRLLREVNSEQDHNNETGASKTPLSESPTKAIIKHEVNQEENSGITADASVSISTPNSELLDGDRIEVQAEPSPSPLPTEEIELSDADNLNVPGQDTKSTITEFPSKIDQDGSGPSVTNSLVKPEAPVADADGTVESLTHPKMPPEDNIPEARVQDQLDEAQGLLKTTSSSGQSKEARLARVCAGLSTRLQEYKSENAQLEELLVAERELCKSYEAHIKQLQQELSSSKSELTRIESNMAEALGTKNSEIEALVSSLDALKKQAAASEGNLASVQANMESIMRNRELTETRMMQALREELTSVERRAEEERSAHNATKLAAMEREMELEHRAVEASTALARIQRVADERTAKAADLERKLALLEVECSQLNQELQDMENRARREQKKSPDEANQMIQMQAWQEELERARQGQRDAESKLSSMEAEVQKMRVEMASMKRDAEHYSRQEHMELEKRYRELTDLLYYKQTQLETMASEKAAAEFQLEKEITRIQEVQIEAERSKVSRRASASWDEEAEIKSLDPLLPLHHRHMAAASLQLQKAAKLLDSGAVGATRFLWRYPTARICFVIYLVFVHLFLMYLLHRLQEQADDLAAMVVDKTMGLSTP